MSERIELHPWTDVDGCTVIATSQDEPAAPALPYVHRVGEDIVLEADTVDPTRFVRLTVALEGEPPRGARSRRLAERLLDASLDAPVVEPARLALLGRLAAIGSTRDDTGDDTGEATGDDNPWWAIEAHLIARQLGCPEVALGDPASLLEAVGAQRWSNVGSTDAAMDDRVRTAAVAALDAVAAAAGVPAPELHLVGGEPPLDPRIRGVEVGVVPPLASGRSVSVPISGYEALAGVFDLSEGPQVALTNDGRSLDIELTVADGAYLQAARSHRVQLQRLDLDLIVGEAPLESRDPEHVAAELRVSKHTLRQPLALRLYHQRLPAGPNRQLVVARAATAHGRAGAALARLGHLEAAEAELAQAATWWRTIGQDWLAAAAQGAAALARGIPPLLGEALVVARRDGRGP